MAKTSYKCSKCPRTFKMAAHLARHMNSIHGTGGKKKRVAAKKGKGKVGRPRAVARKRVGRPKVGVAVRRSGGGEPARLLNDMRLYHTALTSQRNSLDGEIDAIIAAMTALDRGPARRPSRPASAAKSKARKIKKIKARRPAAASGARRGSLKDYIVRVMGKHTKPLGPSDLGAKILKAGFKTKAKDLTKAVSNTLPTIANVKRVGFGKYQLTAK